MQKPGIPKGTRDFGPDEMAKRSYIFTIIKEVFQKYGFLPLETPAMENLNVLMGKYGEEGDRLLFKILNSGDFMSSTDESDISGGSEKIWPKISKKGLRYDLTVPFARYVVMHQNELTFPFKRYQIQPVWRADRPQKGRYQEFFQCDADVIGTDSLICEAEIVLMIKEIFSQLGIEEYSIRINHRKLLSAVSEYIGAGGKQNELFVAIDKLDKVGLENVLKDLRSKGFSEESLNKLSQFLKIKGSPEQVLEKLSPLSEIEEGEKALAELREVLNFIGDLENTPLSVDITLARGLSYYTGTIFEVSLDDQSIGSLSGGGRYDDLTGVFGLKEMSGVGFSLGVDRIYDVMNTRDLFSKSKLKSTDLVILNMGEEERIHAFNLARELRNNSIRTEVYPDVVKLKKQLNYANKKGIPFVLIIGEEELNSKVYTLKDMSKGEQHKLKAEDLAVFIKNPNV